MELRALITRVSLGVTLAVVVAVLTVTISASPAAGSQRGQVGGPPTLALGPPDEGERTTPDLVIGRGDTPTGPVELVAYGWLAPRDSPPPGPREQLCIWVEHLPKEISPGMCGSPLDPEGGQKIAIDDQIRGLGKPAQRFTEIGGRLSPDVASVRISYRRNGHKATGMAVVARVADELLVKLHQSRPFGFFDLRIRGQVPWRSIRIQAYDATGALLETVGPGSSAHHAHDEQPSSAGSSPPVPSGFRLKATNGYSLIALGVPAHEGHPAFVALVVRKSHQEVFYSVPATVTETSIQASLGELGEIAVTFHPSGQPRTTRPQCGGKPVSFDSGSYEGTIDFHGEQGYTEVESTVVPGDVSFGSISSALVAGVGMAPSFQARSCAFGALGPVRNFGS